MTDANDEAADRHADDRRRRGRGGRYHALHRRWLRHAGPQARRLCSVCTGAFALGAAGLIDGKRVTTHWAFAQQLAAKHPAARVEVDPIFLRDGSLYSSAGVTAGIDLALALVADDHGRDFALDVARFLVRVLQRSGGQAQFSAHLKAQFSQVPAVRRIQQWALEHLDGDSALRHWPSGRP